MWGWSWGWIEGGERDEMTQHLISSAMEDSKPYRIESAEPYVAVVGVGLGVQAFNDL